MFDVGRVCQNTPGMENVEHSLSPIAHSLAPNGISCDCAHAKKPQLHFNNLDI